MRVTVAIALPRRQEVIELELREGASVADAIAAANLGERFPGVEVERMKFGIWSRAAGAATLLREGDRVELYRDLRADPKDMRRARARLRSSSRSRNEP